MTDLNNSEAKAGHRMCRSASLFGIFPWLAPSASSFPCDATKRTPKHAELVPPIVLCDEKRNRANVRAKRRSASNGQRVPWSSRQRQAQTEGCAATRECRAMRTVAHEPAVRLVRFWPAGQCIARETAIFVDEQQGARQIHSRILSSSLCRNVHCLGVQEWRG